MDELIGKNVPVDLGVDIPVMDILAHSNAIMTLAGEAVSIHDLSIEGLTDPKQTVVNIPLLWALNSMVRSNKTLNPLEAVSQAVTEIIAFETYLKERTDGAVTFECPLAVTEAFKWFYHFDWIERLEEIKDMTWLFNTDMGADFILRSDLRESLAELRKLPVDSIYDSFEDFLQNSAV